jgi:quercetin dioxygenase-like cupin family protein
MTVPIRQTDLPGPPEGRRFIGADHGGVPISLFLVDAQPGSGPAWHRHPYPEIFIVHAGHAEFRLDDAQVMAAAGDLLVAPAGSAHRFTSTGDHPLGLTAIHTAPRMSTEWLEPANAQR